MEETSRAMQTTTRRNVMKVAVLGAGVIGLTAVSHIQDRFPGQVDLTLISDKFSPHTVSDKSGMIFSLLCHNDATSYQQESEERYKRWIRSSFNTFQSIFKSPDNAAVGISLVHGFALWRSPQPDPWWKDLLFGFRRVGLDSAEAQSICVPPDCAEIWSYDTYTMNPTSLLQWLLGKIRKGGCKVEQRKVSDLSKLTSNYDVVVNCTGLGSCKDLIQDSSLYPVRGQIVLVRAPWIKHWVTFYDPKDIHTAIIPRGSEVVLGGVTEKGDWNEEINTTTTEEILRTCQALVPSLCGAEVVGGWAGLRPGRDRVRLETCPMHNGSTLIHCYGHGGKGVILSWGCAADIGDIMEKRLNA